MPCLTPYRGDTSQMLLFKIASCLEASGAAGASVLSFNGRTSDVILSLADVAAVADGRYVLKAGDTMTGALVHPDGTAALPSITFTGDLDTGIYHPAANTVGVSAGGVLTLSVLTTGINIPSGLAYQYNSVNVVRAQTALANYFFGPSGNLTMTGGNNVATGSLALGANTTGSGNSANGTGALGSNTTGTNNVSFGYLSLASNVSGAGNSAFGVGALFVNDSGSNNSASGASALGGNITGSNNSGIGINALVNLVSGSDNTAIGYNTGLGITTGSFNTIIGANVMGLAAALTNNIIIADGSGNQRITVGSTGIVTIPVALTLSTAAPLSMASGANQRAGDVVLVAGTVTTANTTVTANTRVFVSRKTNGGVPGTSFTYTLIAATSFTITSSNVADTSTISYLLIEVP